MNVKIYWNSFLRNLEIIKNKTGYKFGLKYLE